MSYYYLSGISQRFHSLLVGSSFQTNSIDGKDTITYKLRGNFEKSNYKIKILYAF